MGKTKIEWTDYTFNPWVGCTKVSAACDHCYAESWAKRSGHPELWTGDRRRTLTWDQPRRWNLQAGKANTRYRVFCASLADVFDNQVPEQWRIDLWKLIVETPNLDWQLLTKRPQNIRKMLPWNWRFGFPYLNVWLGVTAENQEEFDRRCLGHLRELHASIRFISYEPALGPLKVTSQGFYPDWVICGGESGPGARMMDLAWARSLRDECAEHGIPFFFKQTTGKRAIPPDLMVRQFPCGD